MCASVSLPHVLNLLRPRSKRKQLISWMAMIPISSGHRWSLCTCAVSHQLFNASDTHGHINSSLCPNNRPSILCKPGSLIFLLPLCCKHFKGDKSIACVHKHLYNHCIMFNVSELDSDDLMFGIINKRTPYISLWSCYEVKHYVEI